MCWPAHDDDALLDQVEAHMIEQGG